MKKVLLFLDYYGNGGIESVIKNINQSLNDEYNFKTLTFVNHAKINNVSNILKKDIKVSSIRNIIGLLKLKKYMKNSKYDIVHIHCYNAMGLVYAFFFKKYSNKIIIHAHNNNFDNNYLYLKSFINKLLKLFFSKKYILVGCSKSANKFCFGKNGIVIPNGIDYSKFLFNKKKRTFYRNKYKVSNKKVIGSVGRFSKQKNHKFIINLFSKLIQNNKDYYLVLIGEGKYLNKVKKRVKKLKIENHVLFITKTDKLYELINMFDIYIQPSLYEGFGLSLIEDQVNGRLTFISKYIDDDKIISNNCYKLNLNYSSWINAIKDTRYKTLSLDDKYNNKNFISNIKELY